MTFAVVTARLGAIMLIGAPRVLGAIHPEGIARFADPRQLIEVPCPLKGDALWSAETALRSGSIDSVLLVLDRTPDLTALRRLQLAAQDGNSLGLLITDRPAANSAAETRWLCRPYLSNRMDSTRLHLSLYKNKKGTLGSWLLDVKGDKDTLDLDAAPAGEPVWPMRDANR